ncbi:MAG: tRNA modification GTPase, partial [Arenicella sp.]
MQNLQDTITAPATPAGVSALAVVRVSGNDAIAIANKCFDKD